MTKLRTRFGVFAAIVAAPLVVVACGMGVPALRGWSLDHTSFDVGIVDKQFAAVRKIEACTVGIAERVKSQFSSHSGDPSEVETQAVVFLKMQYIMWEWIALKS